MSDDALIADANLAEIARLRSELKGMHHEYEQQRESLVSERAARELAEADAAAFRRVVEVLSRAGDLASVRGVARTALSRVGAGAQLLAELKAACEIVATLRQHWHAGGEVWRSIDQDLATYDAAVKGDV